MLMMNSQGHPDELYLEMKSPHHMMHKERLLSFKKNWPKSLKYLSEPLSDAGFYYTQTGDEVECFSCGGALKNWNDGEQPWDEHATWFPKCDFLNMVKGKIFIDFVRSNMVVKV